MLHKEFWGLVFLGFVAWVILASDPQIRMARACEPIIWTGNVAASLTAFASSGGAASVQKWGDKLDYGCRYTLWRLFYQSAYNKAMGTKQPAPAGYRGGAPSASQPMSTASPTGPQAGAPVPVPAGAKPLN